jgi:hypothetical protein
MIVQGFSVAFKKSIWRWFTLRENPTSFSFVLSPTWLWVRAVKSKIILGTGIRSLFRLR